MNDVSRSTDRAPQPDSAARTDSAAPTDSAARPDSAAPTDRATHTYRKLRDLIVRGLLAPGGRLIETELADRLGVSRSPVRAALQRLAQERYVLTDGDGSRSRPSVSPLTTEDAQELFTIVGIVEGLAARRAAELPSPERRKAVQELRAINQEFRKKSHASDPDFKELYDVDARFHRRYVEAGAGPRLLALHDSIKPQAERYGRVYTSVLTAKLDISVREHKEIVDAIAAPDPERAEAAVRTNWRNAAQRLGQAIEIVGERGSW